MNTEQSYFAQDTCATTSEQTANQNSQAFQTFPMPEGWQRTFLLDIINGEKRSEYLFRLLDLARIFSETTDPTGAVSEMMSNWVGNPLINIASQENRSHIRTTVNHLALLAEIRTAFYCFNNETDYVDAAEE